MAFLNAGDTIRRQKKKLMKKRISELTPDERREYNKSATRAYRARVLANPKRAELYRQREHEAHQRYAARKAKTRGNNAQSNGKVL